MWQTDPAKQPINQPCPQETHAKERAAQAQTRQQATWLTVSRLAGGPGQPREKQHLKAWGWCALARPSAHRADIWSLRNAFDRPATPEQAPSPSFGFQGEIKSKQPRMGGQGVEMNPMARSDEACGKQARTCRLVKFGGLKRPSRTPRLSSASRVSHRRCRVVISTVTSSQSYPRSTVRILICSVRHYWATLPHRRLREAHPGREIVSPPRLSQFWVPRTVTESLLSPYRHTDAVHCLILLLLLTHLSRSLTPSVIFLGLRNRRIPVNGLQKHALYSSS